MGPAKGVPSSEDETIYIPNTNTAGDDSVAKHQNGDTKRD